MEKSVGFGTEPVEDGLFDAFIICGQVYVFYNNAVRQ